MPAEQAIAQAVARTNAVLQRVMIAIAQELRVRLASLNTVDGRFVRDQGRLTRNLASDIAEIARDEVPQVIQTIVDDLGTVLEETLRDHPQLGSYRPEITEDLIRLFRGAAEEVARDIVDGTADEVAAAVERIVATGQDLNSAARPVAEAMNTSRRRAATAIERAVREFHERAITEMGKRSEIPFLYVYVGPDETSPNIRPYCAARTGRVMTQEQVDALDPRERFNCRHSLAPVTPEDAEGRPRFEG